MLFKLISALLFLSQLALASDLYPSSFDSTLYEVNRIEFEGNKFFSYEDLYYFIKTKESNISTIHYTLDSYQKNLSENKYTPQSILNGFDKALKPFKDTEYQFFNKGELYIDSISLFNLYFVNGFQQVKTNYSTFKDTIKKSNVLKFSIKENQRFILDTIEFITEDTLEDDLENRLRSFDKISDKPFSEKEVLLYSSELKNFLLNDGYYTSEVYINKALSDTTKKTVSIELYLKIGKRYQIGSTKFIHNRGNQKKISDLILFRMLTYDTSEIYSKKKMKSTEANLLSLGIFNKTGISHSVDSINKKIDLSIICDYRQQQEFDVDPGINRTEDNFNNAFLRIGYEHKNVFGGAQIFKPQFSINFRNINNFDVNDPFGQIEYSLNTKYYSPVIFSLYDASFDIEAKPVISLRTLFSTPGLDFRIFRWGFPITLPVKFKTDLDITAMNFKLNIESENPLNFNVLIDGDLVGQNVDQVLQQFVTYYDLNEYVNNKKDILDNITSLLFGVSVTRDKRDNPFYPASGHYLNLDLELSPIGDIGLTQFVKFIGDGYYFKRLNKNLVWGLKSKIGVISFLDAGNNYVPIEKQFFAGGANSFRGWESRRLRFTKSYNDTTIIISSFLENFIGNSSLVEFTSEFRYDLNSPRSLQGVLADVINSSAFTMFLDFGNASNWLISNSSFSLSDFSPANFAYSFGIGYNYKTPIGPFRIDYGVPLYGPSPELQNYNDYKFLLQNSGDLFEGVFHVAIGYSF